MATMHDTVASLLSPPKGILAADEHLGKPWQQVARAGTGPAATPEERYHELLLTTPDLDTYLSGVIVSAGSFSRREFPPADSLIVAGVRLGTGTDLWPDGSPAADGDQTDELRTRLGHLRESGARFAKWRADLDPMGKSRPAGYVDTKFLAQCAASSQEVSLLPVLDVAMPNQRSHSLAVAEAVTANALDSLFVELEARHVDLRTVLLRMNMVQAGEWHDQETTPDEVAQSTAKVMSEHIPPALAGILFMSTGQDNARACANLAAVVSAAASRPDITWPITYAFGRALVAKFTDTWAGDAANVDRAQRALIEDCARASSAVTPVAPTTA